MANICWFCGFAAFLFFKITVNTVSLNNDNNHYLQRYKLCVVSSLQSVG